MRQDVLTRRHALTERQLTAVGFVMEQGRQTIWDTQHRCSETPRCPSERDLRVLVEKCAQQRRLRSNRPKYVLARGASRAQVIACAKLAPLTSAPDSSLRRPGLRRACGRPLESSGRTSPRSKSLAMVQV